MNAAVRERVTRLSVSVSGAASGWLRTAQEARKAHEALEAFREACKAAQRERERPL